MKKLVALFLALAMTLALVACGQKETKDPQDNPEQNDTEQAQTTDWPKRTITMQVGFKAGGDTDYYARMLAQYLEGILGETVVVVNTAGVNGQVAAREVMESEPDGYTCYFTHTVSWYQEACGTVDGFSYIDDFEPAGIAVADKTFCIAMRADSGIKTVDDLVAYLKDNPEGLSVSTSYAGLADYVVYQFEKATGVKMEGVDIGSNATDRVVGLLNGSVDILPINYSNIADYVTTGEVVVLGVCADERCAYLPDVPTLAEQGVDCSATKYYYVNFPKGTDSAIIERFTEAMKAVTEMPEFAEAISTFNGEPCYVSASDHAAFAQETIDEMKALVG